MIIFPQIIAITISMFMVVLIIELVRRKKMREKHALFWLLPAFGALILSVFLKFFGTLIKGLGIIDPGILILFLSFSFLFIVVLYLFIQLSRQSDEIRILVQKIGRLDLYVRELRNKYR